MLGENEDSPSHQMVPNGLCRTVNYELFDPGLRSSLLMIVHCTYVLMILHACTVRKINHVVSVLNVLKRGHDKFGRRKTSTGRI